MIKFFKRDGRKRKLKHHHHSGSFSYDYFGLKDLITKDSKTLYVVLNKTFLTKTASIQLDKSISSFSGYKSDNYADIEDFSLGSRLPVRNQRLHKTRSSRNLSFFGKSSQANYSLEV